MIQLTSFVHRNKFAGATLAAAVAVASFSLNAANPAPRPSSAPTPVIAATATPASTAQNRGVGEESVNVPGGRPIKQVIQEAKQADLAGFNRRVKTLKSSPEFTSFLTARAGSPEAGGIEGLAAVLTDEQARAFVKAIKGKSFSVFRDIQGNENVTLAAPQNDRNNGNFRTAGLVNTKGETPTVENAAWTPPSCWQGWFAAAGYQAATGAICGSLGAMSFGIVGAVCGSVAWSAGMGINWNDACR